MKEIWDEFIIEGDFLYNYMITNLDNMFNESSINDFTIIDGICRNTKNNAKLEEELGENLQKNLINWIKNEHIENRLFNKILWKPFRDLSTMIYMYYGYRKLFFYKDYIFQLGIIKEFDVNINNEHINQYGYFVLALYGWKENNYDIILPYKKKIILQNNLLPDNHWHLQ